MKNDNLRKIITIYLLVFLLFSLIFILFFHSPLFSKQKVLFYRGAGLLVVTTIITLLIEIIIFNRRWKLKTETLIAALVLSFAIHLSFFVVFPVTFDRSITMYLLNTLKRKQNSEICKGLNEKELEELFIKEYVKESQAVNRRIVEQSLIDFVERQDDCIQLTAKGDKFLRTSEVIKKIYGIR